MRTGRILAVLGILMTPIVNAQDEALHSIAQKYNENLQQIIVLQKQIKSLHPVLNNLYPIAIVEEGNIHVFDLNERKNRYELKKVAPDSMSLQQGIRAAFPLEAYDFKTVCVVTGEIFLESAGYATIFHEFVHCYQGHELEAKLKEKLSVAQKAMQEKRYSWELDHPFPYEDKTVAEIYSLILNAAAEKDIGTVTRCCKSLREILNRDDYEYMVWQEWKEGFARYIENLIRQKFQLEENHGGADPPFNRVSFYEGGSRIISLLLEEDKGLKDDLEGLFEKLLFLGI